MTPAPSTGWSGTLDLHYRASRREGQRHTSAQDRHEGPLRVLRRLYPEGPGICHHVLVHPPGGLVGGDRLTLSMQLDADAHAVLTTPGATRWYRSEGAVAQQHVQATLADGARLEWLPLETIVHAGCLGVNRQTFNLAPGAQMIGWDVLALGLPASNQPFDRGCYEQHLTLPGVWLERGVLCADDAWLMDGPVGLAGRRVLATMWFAAGEALPEALRESLLDDARELAEPAAQAPTPVQAGTSAAQPSLVVLRALGDRVEPVMQLLVAVRERWRRTAWSLQGAPLRVWHT